MTARLGRLLCLVGMVVAASTGSARAASASIDPQGTLHRIEIDPYGKRHRLVQPSVLRHFAEDPDGFVHAYVVTGTEDVAEEREPALAIDSISGLPVLTWLRVDDTSTGVFVSKFDGTGWSAPKMVISDADAKSALQLRVGPRNAHVAWSQGPSTPPVPWLASMDRVTLQFVFGPSTLTTDEPSPVPVEGAEAGEASLPPPGDSFFTLTAPARLPEEPPRIVVYGARDEPVPVNFLQGFFLPEEVVSIDLAGAEFFANRMTIWYVSGGHFYYAFREPTAWSSTRMIRLYPLEVADARTLVREMLQRLPPVQSHQ